MPDNGSLPLLQPAAKLLGANSQRQPGFATQPSNASGTPAPGPVAHDQDQQRAAAENVAQFHGMLSSYCAPDQVPFIATSSATGAGCRLLLKYISQLRQTFAPPSFLDAA